MSDVIDPTTLATRPDGALSTVATDPVTMITDLVRMGIDKGITPDGLEKLSGMLERAMAKDSRQKFNAALDRFQQQCPRIPKNKTAKIQTKSGGGYAYKFADLDSIMVIVRPLLHKHGFSFKWDSTTDKNQITCTFILSHVDGHQEPSSFTCPTDTAAAMSGAQASGAALTFAQRRSMLQGLGINPCDHDTDANRGDVEKISEHQAANLSVLIDDVGADRERFLKHFGISALSDLPLGKHHEAITALEARRGNGAKKP